MNAHRVDIYLLPIGSQAYELYCEPVDHISSMAGDRPSGWRARASRTFHGILAYVENERHRRHERERAQQGRTWYQRVRDRLMAWIAERVAEQRLLWRLRSVTEATVHHPDDVDDSRASMVVMSSLKRDGIRHLVWMVVDTCAYLASLPLSVLPGPNPLSWYFSFRAIGHLLSVAGAWRGLRRAAWSYVPCAPLADLRRCRELDPVACDALANVVARRLDLRHLAAFVERMTAIRP